MGCRLSKSSSDEQLQFQKQPLKAGFTTPSATSQSLQSSRSEASGAANGQTVGCGTRESPSPTQDRLSSSQSTRYAPSDIDS
ncbi:unnamed protein product [Enterobius vermicularis]|uniref:PDE4DIP n=1 Tax=Enterobius vermicularis TaxID=51028 RepID=A0A0N4V3Z8_ENTVE|nr:unnamed protein product [Enterobius vermicularis]